MWSDAASAGAALAVAAIGAALAWSGGGGGGERVAEAWLAIPAEPNDAAFLLRSAAGAFALAGFLPFAMPSLGAPLGEAQRAGASGLILALIAAALGAAGLGRFRARRRGGAVADRGGAGRRRGLAAGGGARARWRADGGARLRRRLVGRLCAFRRARQPTHRAVAPDDAAGDRRVRRSPSTAASSIRRARLRWALGVNLALVTPAVALALAERGGPRSAAVLLATAAIMFAAALGPDWRSAPPQQILVAALVAGAIGLLAGALGALFERRDPPLRRDAASTRSPICPSPRRNERSGGQQPLAPVRRSGRRRRR